MNLTRLAFSPFLLVAAYSSPALGHDFDFSSQPFGGHPACQPSCGTFPPEGHHTFDRKVDGITRNLLQQAFTSLQERDFNQAAISFRAAYQRAPYDAQIGFWLAGTLYSAGDFEGARPLISQLLQERNRLSRQQRQLMSNMIETAQ